MSDIAQLSNVFRPLSRVSLKFYPKLTGRIRRIEYNVEDKNRLIFSNVAHIYWDDGKTSYCPLDRLMPVHFYPEKRYPWEKHRIEKDETPDVEVLAGKHDV